MDARRYVKVAQDIYIDTIGPENTRRRVPLAEIVVGLFSVCIIGAILFPVFSKPREIGCHGPTCQSNLKQMGLGIAQYTQDYDECYPLTALHGGDESPYGWADVIQPYLKSTQIYHCPLKDAAQAKDIDHAPDPRSFNYTDYWMNRNLSGVYSADVNHPATTLLYGDGNDGHDATNARYSFCALPFAWQDDYNAPSWRHHKGANYCYADGHVKWRAGALATKNTSDFTFALK